MNISTSQVSTLEPEEIVETKNHNPSQGQGHSTIYIYISFYLYMPLQQEQLGTTNNLPNANLIADNTHKTRVYMF